MTITYVVVRTGLPHHIPNGVSGRSGLLYGHGRFEDRYNGHVLRIPQKQWEGGAAKDILERVNRGSSVLLVYVEVETDGESQEAKLAEALDAARTEIDSLKRHLADSETRLAETSEPCTHRRVAVTEDGGRCFECGADMHSDPVTQLWGIAPPVAKEPDVTAEATAPVAMFPPDAGTADAETEAAGPIGPPNEETRETRAQPMPSIDEIIDAERVRLDDLPFREIRAEAKAANEFGAKIDLTTKDKMRDGLLDWKRRESERHATS